jgi:Putative Flp pilus-assembly TadE/G-like
MLRRRGGSERGSVAITVTLALTVLLGFAALVVDVGLNWAARASAQTAADSAALAGATRLLADGPAAAVLTVRDYLNRNVPGLVAPPGDLAWVDDGDVSDGEIVCWTLPAPPPDPPPGGAANCPPGSNALQVITPPIEVDYAFAGVLGERSNEIKARAAAGAGPAAPNNCVLCVLEPTGSFAMNVLGGGEVEVEGGGIAVNSSNLAAMALSGGGDVSADQIRVVGGFSPPTGGGDFIPLPELGGPPVADPLAGLRTPDRLVPAPAPQVVPPLSGTVILPPGVYPSVTVDAGVTVSLEEGVYVFTEAAGLTIRDGGRVVGAGATVYLACEDYPAPCSGAGARFRLEDGGQFAVSAPAGGEYAGLSIFADRANTTVMRLLDDVSLGGALYGASTSLRLRSANDVRVNSLLVVDTLRVNDSDLEVDYDPSSPLPGIGRPVLIR